MMCSFLTKKEFLELRQLVALLVRSFTGEGFSSSEDWEKYREAGKRDSSPSVFSYSGNWFVFLGKRDDIREVGICCSNGNGWLFLCNGDICREVHLPNDWDVNDLGRYLASELTIALCGTGRVTGVTYNRSNDKHSPSISFRSASDTPE